MSDAPATAPAAPENILSTPAEPAQGAPANAAPASGGQAPAEAIQEPFWKGWVNEDGSVNKDRYKHLPDELKDIVPSLSQLNNLPDILKTWKHDRSLVGKKGLLPLRADASEGEIAEFKARQREVLGVPKDYQGYEVAKPEDIPDDYWNQEYVDDIRKVFHDEAISPAAAKRLAETNANWTKKLLAQQEAQQVKAREDYVKSVNAAVAKEWGNDVPEKLALARNAAKHFGIDPTSPIFTDNPEVAFAMAKAGQLLKEGKLVDGDSSSAFGPSAQEQLDALTKDQTNKFNIALRDGPRNPLFDEAVKKQAALAKQVAEERARKASR